MLLPPGEATGGQVLGTQWVRSHSLNVCSSWPRVAGGTLTLGAFGEGVGVRGLREARLWRSR